MHRPARSSEAREPRPVQYDARTVPGRRPSATCSTNVPVRSSVETQTSSTSDHDADGREQDLQHPGRAWRAARTGIVVTASPPPAARRNSCLVDHLDAELLRLGELRARVLPRDHEGGLLRHARGDAGARRLRPAPSPPRARSSSRPPVSTTESPSSGPRAGVSATSSSASRTPAARSFSISARFSSSSNHSRTVAAISGPISGTASISSSLAAASASIEPNARASTWATWRPDVADVQPDQQPPERPVLRRLDLRRAGS